ncbi:sigma factor [Cellulomonas sp. FA1]|uniref:sigma factor n=1 Tax=Cellulomonas sp. FA1 TaxID=1346710 RepID=UPI000ADB3303|nr:sigma factor [Cellulomonas sp. FA1]
MHDDRDAPGVLPDGAPSAAQVEEPRPDDDRRLLLDVAYRLLGSVAEAEDAVQETYVRWFATPAAERARVVTPTAWRVTVCSRVCLDVLRSARVRRERSAGERLPEPVPGAAWTSRAATAGAGDPADLLTADESLRTAFLVVLARTTPAERVALVLHDVFGYAFAEVADVLGRSPAACRQLASSARRRVGAEPARRAPVDPAVVDALRDAWRRRDVAAVVAVLDPSCVAVVDGGGVVSAPAAPVVGATAVAELLAGVAERAPGLALARVVANGEPALLAHDGGQVLAVVGVGVRDGRVVDLWVVRDPARLRGWRVPA